jgi:hypothetical protein
MVIPPGWKMGPLISIKGDGGLPMMGYFKKKYYIFLKKYRFEMVYEAVVKKEKTCHE